MKTKAKIIRIKIIDNGKKIINLLLPTFLITTFIFFIPEKLIEKWSGQEVNVKEFIRNLIKEGRGTKINIKDKDTLVKIELK